jgi:GTP cyclohydrolase I
MTKMRTGYNIIGSFSKADLKSVKSNVEEAVEKLLGSLGFDTDDDQNLKNTPKRVAKMFVDELFVGCYTEEPKITVFDNTEEYDEMVVYGPINLKSTCSHHFVPFVGKCYIGYIPDKKVVGLSKLARITHWFMRRPQLQEELTSQIANYIQEKLEPQGVGVVIKAQHFCTIARGVEEENSWMTTSKLVGSFRDDLNVKSEFITFVGNGK